MATKKFNTGIEIDNGGVAAKTGGSATQVWRTDGSKGIVPKDTEIYRRMHHISRAHHLYDFPVGLVTGVANDYSDFMAKKDAISTSRRFWVVKKTDGFTAVAIDTTYINIDLPGLWLSFARLLTDASMSNQYYFEEPLTQIRLGTTLRFSSGTWVIYDGSTYQAGTWTTNSASFCHLINLMRPKTPTASDPVDYSDVVKVTAQTFNETQQEQGRTNLSAEKLSTVVILNTAPTTAELLANLKNTILKTSGANTAWVLPISGALPDGWQVMVKTNADSSINFSVADATVSIEYNEVGAIGHMTARSEAWIMLKNNIYYINGEVG